MSKSKSKRAKRHTGPLSLYIKHGQTSITALPPGIDVRAPEDRDAYERRMRELERDRRAREFFATA